MEIADRRACGECMKETEIEIVLSTAVPKMNILQMEAFFPTQVHSEARASGKTEGKGFADREDCGKRCWCRSTKMPRPESYEGEGFGTTTE